MCLSTWTVLIYFKLIILIEWQIKQMQQDKELTAREREIVVLIGKNLKYKEIATKLKLGYETVKTYVKRIRKKLNLSSKLEVGLWGYKQGWID
jgi:DNA-binding CsgD family transcriptional regulator